MRFLRFFGFALRPAIESFLVRLLLSFLTKKVVFLLLRRCCCCRRRRFNAFYASRRQRLFSKQHLCDNLIILRVRPDLSYTEISLGGSCKAFFRLAEPFEDVVEADDAWMMNGVGLVITVGLRDKRHVKK